MKKAIIITALLITAFVLYSERRLIEAQAPTASFPALVLRDSTGDVVGPVVQIGLIERNSLSDDQLVLVIFHDETAFDAPFLVQFGRDWFRPQDRSSLYFRGLDCIGLAYLEDPGLTLGLPNMRGTVFARGPEQVIYRTNIGAVPTTISFQSTFTSFNFSLPFSQCLNSPNMSRLVEAAPVMDLSRLKSPYTIE